MENVNTQIENLKILATQHKKEVAIIGVLLLVAVCILFLRGKNTPEAPIGVPA